MALIITLGVMAGVSAQDETGGPDLRLSEPSFPGTGDERVQVVVHNRGDETASPAGVEVVVRASNRSATALANETASIEAGGYDIVEVQPEMPSTGLVRIEATVDPAGEIQEADGGNNQASTAYLAAAGGDGPPSRHVFFTTGEDHVAGDRSSVRVHEGSLSLEGPEGAEAAFIDRTWMNDRLGPVGSPAPFDLVTRVNSDYAIVDDPGLLEGDQPAFRPIDLQDETGLHTVGEPGTIQLQERSMKIHVAETPGYGVETRTVETENGTHQHRTRTDAAERIAIDFTSENTTGQAIHINTSWLERYGITSPTFEHEDGTEVVSYRNGDHYVVVPEHFSYLYIWDDEGAWDREVDQDYSHIYWNVTGGKMVTVEADRRDPGDEVYSNPFRTAIDGNRKFSISGDWTVDEVGHWQFAYPLVVANSAVTNINDDPMSFYVRYKSQGETTDQEYLARFIDGSGTQHTLFRYSNGQKAEQYRFSLSYDAGHRELTAEMRDSTGTLLAQGSYSLSKSQGLGLEKVAVATEGRSESSEPITRAHVDNVEVEIEDNLIGEVGVTPLSNDDWGVDDASIGDLVPRVFGATQTVNGDSDPSQVHVTDIYNGDDGDLEVQHCEWDPADICDTHATEDVGWVAFDRGDNRLPVKGMYFSTKTTSSGVAEDHMEFRYHDRIQNKPLVFAQTTTNDGSQVPRNVQVMNVGIDIATIEFCEHDTSDAGETWDACDKHTSETVEGWAIDPQVAERGHTFDWGQEPVENSGWTPISFEDQNFQDPPVVLSMVQTENGGQEALYSEVKGVTSEGAWIRYCEGHDDSDTGNVDENNCDNHATETVAWVAIRNRDNGEVWMDTDVAPEACFTSDVFGREVTVDASCTTDDHSDLVDLQFKWDFQGDGVYETGWRSSPTYKWDYGSNGDKLIEVAVKDEAADIGKSLQSVTVHSFGLPYAEDFDGGAADQWELEDEGLWHVTDLCSTPPSTPYYLGYHRVGNCDYDDGSTAGDAVFNVDLAGVSEALLTFDNWRETEEADDWDNMSVGYNDGTGWEALKTFHGTDSNLLEWEKDFVNLGTEVTGDYADIRFRFNSGDSFDNDQAGWFIDNVEVQEGSNQPPTASWSYNTDGLTLNVDASTSDDPDGDSLTYEWVWGDGNSDTTTSATTSHTYDVCPDGAFEVTLTVHDGFGGDDDETQSVTVVDHDDDTDGLANCTENNGPDWDGDGVSDDPTDPNDPDTDGEGREDGTEVNSNVNSDPTVKDTDGEGLDDWEEVNKHGTDPTDIDSDNDEFRDDRELDPSGSESYFGLTDTEADTILCGSECAYPDPTVQDIYLEIDGWKSCNIFGSCDTFSISESQADNIIQAYSNNNVNMHLDDGRFGDGGEIIPNESVTANFPELDNEYEDNDNYFHPDRQDIFHQMIWVDNLDDSNGDGRCGLAEGSDFDDNALDFSAIAAGEFDNELATCSDGPASESEAQQDTTMEELGHNDLQYIEPESDSCDPEDDPAHDEFDKYVIECGSHAELIDYHKNRWTEFSEAVGSDGDPFNDEEWNLDRDSVGDMNNGFESSSMK